MSDRRLYPRSAGKNPRQCVFVGTHEKLETGRMYVLSEVARIIGVNDKTMHSRMVGKHEITDKEVRETQDAFGGKNKNNADLYARLENKCMKESGKWLRRKL